MRRTNRQDIKLTSLTLSGMHLSRQRFKVNMKPKKSLFSFLIRVPVHKCYSKANSNRRNTIITSHASETTFPIGHWGLDQIYSPMHRFSEHFSGVQFLTTNAQWHYLCFRNN